MGYRAVALAWHPGPALAALRRVLPRKMGMVLADPAQAEIIGTVGFTAAPKRAGPAPNIAGIPRAITACWGHRPHPENARTFYSFPYAFGGPAKQNVNNSQLGGLTREEGSSVNFTARRGRCFNRDLGDLMKDEGLEVIECTSAEAAELVVASPRAELKALVADVSLSGEISGVELARYAKRKFPHINVIMVSGRSPPYIPQDASFC
jgi:hypothetical protein